jgi:hypothetical protein
MSDIVKLQPATTDDNDSRLFELCETAKKYALDDFECGYNDAIAGRTVGAGCFFPDAKADPVSYRAGYEIGTAEANRWLGVIGVLPAVAS